MAGNTVNNKFRIAVRTVVLMCGKGLCSAQGCKFDRVSAEREVIGAGVAGSIDILSGILFSSNT